eukprot:TRINITY_DN10392_c0_g1_i1.p1 TRINITY_DN10392_c0_g1~~TRINITY_DN10392_c0_g1_i1.p1  ORF type:complete len:456 (+),score=74.77 TRINITY_DN10392_c0_g1_i1:49-1416(+)
MDVGNGTLSLRAGRARAATIGEDLLFEGKYLQPQAINDNEFEEEEEPLVEVSPKPDRVDGTYFTYFAFFMMGISLFMAWGSISFLVSYWVWRYEDELSPLWPAFLLAYNLPGLPLLFLQLKTDRSMEDRFGVWSSYALRLGVTFSLLILITALVPVVNRFAGAIVMELLVVFIGILVGVGSGWLYAMSALFPRKSTAYILIGQGMSTLIILGLTRAFPITPTEHEDQTIMIYFGLVTIISLIGLFVFIALMRTDVAVQSLADDVANIDMDDLTTPTVDIYADEPPTFMGLMKAVWKSYLSSFITNFGIVGASAIVTLVAETSDNPQFPEIMLYVNSLASLAGNEISVLLDRFNFISKQWKLLLFSFIRILIFPLMILYAKYNVFRNDIAFYCLVGVFSLSGAYANSRCFTLANKYAPKGQATDATYWMNIVLYIGVYVGASVPYWIRYLVPEVPK